jgi:hypothetical protein
LLGFWEEIKNASWKDQTLTGLDDCESPTIPQSSKSVKIRSSSWTIFDSPKIHSCKYHWEKVQPREPFLHWMPSMVPQGYLKDENQRYVFFFYKSPESISCSNGEKWGFCSKKKTRPLCSL